MNFPVAYVSAMAAMTVAIEGWQKVAIASTTTSSAVGIVTDDQPAPGAGSGVIFDFPRNACIASDASVLFYSQLLGTPLGDDDNEALWQAAEGNLTLIAREGEQAPGVPDGVVFQGNNNVIPAFNRLSICPSGQACFFGRLGGPGVSSDNDYGLWYRDQGALTLMVREFDPVPGLPNIRFGRLDQTYINLPMNSSGECFFISQLSGPGVNASNDYGFFTATPGNVKTLLRLGDVHSGTGATWVGWSNNGLLANEGMLSDSGSLALRGLTRLNSIDRWGIWILSPGTPPVQTLIANAGSPAIDIPGAVYTNDILEPSMSRDGRVGFVAAVSGTGINDGNDRGLWAGSSGKMHLVAREGDTWKNAPSGQTIGPAFSTPFFLPNNRVMFRNVIRGPGVTSLNDYGAWIVDETGVHLVLREGQQIQNESPGTVLGSFNGPSDSFSVNNAGQIVLESSFKIYVSDSYHGLFSVLRPGDNVEVSPGDVRPLALHGAIDTSVPFLNESGEFVATVSYGVGQLGLARVAIAPPPPKCPDANNDGAVDAADLSVLLAQFGTSVTAGSGADLNGDGLVNAADLSVLLSSFGSMCQ